MRTHIYISKDTDTHVDTHRSWQPLRLGSLLRFQIGEQEKREAVDCQNDQRCKLSAILKLHIYQMVTIYSCIPY